MAGTIAAATNNGVGTAGIAYGSRIMPVRTLDAYGGGDAVTITRGIRYAVRHHADVINLSLEFGPQVRAADIPDLLAAIRYARRHRVVLTGVAGNEGSQLAARTRRRAKGVIAVAATTEDGCQAKYSNAGGDVDVAAPGGGDDATPAGDAWDQAHCHPGVPLRSIYQQTFTSSPARFGLPSGYLRNIHGGAPCGRGGGPPDRVKAAWIAAEPRRCGATNRTDRRATSAHRASMCATGTD